VDLYGPGGYSRGLREALSLNLLGGTEKTHETLRIADVGADFRAEYSPEYESRTLSL
jgi:hypothetical protein